MLPLNFPGMRISVHECIPTLRFAGMGDWSEPLTVSWEQLEAESPEVAAFGQARIDGKVAYLATVCDDFPRVHPVTPIIGNGRCFIFAEPDSLKVRDLLANPRYSLHCGMSDSSGSSGEFRIRGTAIAIDDDVIRAEAEAVCSFRPSVRSRLFELTVAEAVSTSWRRGRPDRRRWSTQGEVA